MIELEFLIQMFDKYESIVHDSDFDELYEHVGGYNLYDDGDSKQFDFEDCDCIFTVRKYHNEEYCVLVNEFNVYINDEFVEFARC